MSGSHRSQGGGYRNDEPTAPRSGEYDAPAGYRPAEPPIGDPGYRTASGNYRTPDGYRTSGGYRTTSGSHRTASGSHRIAQSETRWGWRMALVLAGAVAGVAACAVMIVLVMGRAANTTGGGSARHATAQKESSNAGSREFSIVPDSCTLITNDQATQLVDSFQQNPSTATDNDQHSQCVWTNFAAGAGRQLTVELRAIPASGGKSASATAHGIFVSEQAGDSSNGASPLDTSQTVAAHQPLSGFGAEAYLTYTSDTTQGFGEAWVNLRSGNLLVTVRYGGNAGGAPLDQQKSTEGAEQAAQHVLEALAKS